jgi:predicted transcriptional regulator
MLFRVTIAEYDSDTERAYVELRAPDDGEEIIATTIFSFRSKTKLNKPQIK